MPKPQKEQSIAKQYAIWTKDMLTKYKKGDVPYTVPSWLKKYPKFNEKAITFIDKLQKGLESGKGYIKGLGGGKAQNKRGGGKVKKYAHGGKVRSYNFIN